MRFTIAIALAGSAVFAASALASSVFPGSGATFVFFTLAFVVLVVLAAPQPRLYVYTFLAAFLAFGFWLKVLFHLLAAPGFVEPVGDFDYSPAAWDRALIVAGCGALGVAAARLAHLRWARNARGAAGNGAPAWYVRRELQVWLLTVALMVLVNAANLHFAFYQTGVRPRLLLPLRAHVVLGWAANMGFALWVATLLWWRHQRAGLSGRMLLVPLAEAFVAASSAYSRMIFPLRMAAYLLALFERRRDVLPAIGRRALYWLGGAVAVSFAATLLIVFGLRVYYYFGYAEGTAQAPFGDELRHAVAAELPRLFVHRWVGLEGVLAVGAAERAPRRLAEALTEPPERAGESMFQRVARPAYLSERPEQFIFLANAGPVALLWFSGSLVVVFTGMALLAFILLVTEEAARRLIGNPFLLAVAGAGLANVLSQTNFFYLTAIFLLQLWLALALVFALERAR